MEGLELEAGIQARAGGRPHVGRQGYIWRYHKGVVIVIAGAGGILEGQADRVGTGRPEGGRVGLDDVRHVARMGDGGGAQSAIDPQGDAARVHAGAGIGQIVLEIQVGQHLVVIQRRLGETDVGWSGCAHLIGQQRPCCIGVIDQDVGAAGNRCGGRVKFQARTATAVVEHQPGSVVAWLGHIDHTNVLVVANPTASIEPEVGRFGAEHVAGVFGERKPEAIVAVDAQRVRAAGREVEIGHGRDGAVVLVDLLGAGNAKSGPGIVHRELAFAAGVSEVHDPVPGDFVVVGRIG